MDEISRQNKTNPMIYMDMTALSSGSSDNVLKKIDDVINKLDGMPKTKDTEKVLSDLKIAAEIINQNKDAYEFCKDEMNGHDKYVVEKGSDCIDKLATIVSSVDTMVDSINSDNASYAIASSELTRAVIGEMKNGEYIYAISKNPQMSDDEFEKSNVKFEIDYKYAYVESGLYAFYASANLYGFLRENLILLRIEFLREQMLLM